MLAKGMNTRGKYTFETSAWLPTRLLLERDTELAKAVDALVHWAEARGAIPNLIAAAVAAKPFDRNLGDFAKSSGQCFDRGNAVLVRDKARKDKWVSLVTDK